MGIEKKSLSEKEVFLEYGIPRSTLRYSRWAANKSGEHVPVRMPYVKLGTKILYLREDIEAFLAKNRVVPGGAA